MTLGTLLLVDPDHDYTDTLCRDPSFARITPTVVGSGDEAQAVLAKPGACFRSIVLSTAVTSPSALHLIRLAQELHPVTPLFLLYDGEEEPLSRQEIDRLALRGCISRTPNLLDLWSRVTAVYTANATPTADAVVVIERTETPSASDAEFRAVWIEEFLHGFPSFYDVYFRAPAGKYLKILNAKDLLDPQRAQHYIDRGVDRLYIRRSSQDRLLSYCTLLASALIRRSSGISIELKFGELASSGAELAKRIRETSLKTGLEADLGDVHLDFAFSYLADLFSVVKQTEKQPSSLVKCFLKSGGLMESGVATSMIAALMAHPLGLSTSREFTPLGLAALLHDIGLLMLPEHIREMPHHLLNQDELRVYETHPQLGVNALRPLSRRVGAATLQAIAQHHERRNGSGFPQRTKPVDIHFFAEVIGLADDFLALLREKRSNSKIDLAFVLEGRILRAFSPKVADAFRAIFLPPKAKPSVRRGRRSSTAGKTLRPVA